MKITIDRGSVRVWSAADAELKVFEGPISSVQSALNEDGVNQVRILGDFWIQTTQGKVHATDITMLLDDEEPDEPAAPGPPAKEQKRK